MLPNAFLKNTVIDLLPRMSSQKRVSAKYFVSKMCGENVSLRWRLLCSVDVMMPHGLMALILPCRE